MRMFWAGLRAVLHLVQLVAHGMVMPPLRVALVVPQTGADVPSVGELGDVHVAAHAAAGPEHVRMSEGQEERAMAAHAQARDGTHVTVGMGAVMAVDIGDQLLAHVGLELHLGVDGRVKVPAVLSVGTHDDYAIAVGQPMQVGLAGPVVVAAVGAVQQVEHRVFVGLYVIKVLLGFYDYILDDAIHRLAHHLDGIGRKSGFLFGSSHLDGILLVGCRVGTCRRCHEHHGSHHQ